MPKARVKPPDDASRGRPRALDGPQPSGGSQGGSQQPQRTWVPVQGHDEPVYEDRPVYEGRPVYETVSYYVFSDGYETTSASDAGAYQRKTHLPASTVQRKVQTGTERVQTSTRWVVDVPGHWE